jgi:hypothetical protein
MSTAFQLTGSQHEVKKYADVSACGRYRYALTRSWAEGAFVAWVMLNPSTADAREDDPTIRKVMGFSKTWGYAGCVVVNLFAWRATNPQVLKLVTDPVGPRNLAALRDWTNNKPIVAAWGDSGGDIARRQAHQVRRFLSDSPMLCLGKTKAGNPRHPCRLAYSTPLEASR